MLRIPVVTIDRFKNYLNDDLELEKLLQEIRGEVPPSKFMEIGKGFHDIIENGAERYNAEQKAFISKNNIVFPRRLIYDFFRRAMVIDDAVYEIKKTKNYKILDETVEMVGKADALYGDFIIEFKTTFRTFDYERYHNSFQWRFYLDIFKAKRVYYNVLVLSDTKEGLQWEDFYRFYFTPYRGIKADIKDILNEFVRFIKLQKLEEYFKKDGGGDELLSGVF